MQIIRQKVSKYYVVVVVVIVIHATVPSKNPAPHSPNRTKYNGNTVAQALRVPAALAPRRIKAPAT